MVCVCVRMVHFICLVAHIILSFFLVVIVAVIVIIVECMRSNDGTMQFQLHHNSNEHQRQTMIKKKTPSSNRMRNSGNERVAGHIVIVCAIVEYVL